jgi:hypothetical protein
MKQRSRHLDFFLPDFFGVSVTRCFRFDFATQFNSPRDVREVAVEPPRPHLRASRRVPGAGGVQR